MIRISRLSAAALVVAATFLAAGTLSVSAQQIIAPEKKVAATPATATAPTSSKPTAVKSSTHVYLLRGLLNIFSLGMDDLAEKLRRRGITATVGNHTEWQIYADEIAAQYKAGNRGAVVLIGHSYGADAVMQMGDYLGRKGVPVALIVPIDGSGPLPATANVGRVLNITQRDFARMTRGPGFRGELTNMDVSRDPSIGHLNIDKSERLHALIIGRIMALGGSGRTAPTAGSTPAPASPSAPAPHGQNSSNSTVGAASLVPADASAQVQPAKPAAPAAKKADAPI